MNASRKSAPRKRAIGQIEEWMRNELRLDADAYTDCGEVGRTALGEAYADAHDVGAEIPDEVWDAAHDAATWWEERS